MLCWPTAASLPGILASMNNQKLKSTQPTEAKAPHQRPAHQQSNMEFTNFTITPGTYAIRIKAPAPTDTDGGRAPVHFILLVDTSGSMETEGKLTNVVRSAHFMMDHLQATDQLTLIEFNTTAKLHANRLAMTDDAKHFVTQRLTNLTPAGSTNLSAALLLAKLGVEGTPPTMKTGILILTDGHANVGSTEPEVIRHILQGTTATVNTVGYGTDHNTDLLTAMATDSGGSYNVVSTLEDTATVFGDILGGLLTCVAQNVEIKYPVGTTVHSIFPYEANSLHVGDVQADTTTYIVSSAPATSVTGFMMPAATAFAAVPAEEAAPPAAISLEATVSMIRYKVSKLLLGISHGTGSTASNAAAIAELRVAILGASPHPMWQLLLDQLRIGEDLIHTAHMPSSATILSQRATSIGIGRGVLTGESDPGMASPFANRIQRDISTGLRTTVSSQEPRSLHASPILTGRSIHIEALSTLGELAGPDDDSDMPTESPNSGLQRQMADSYSVLPSATIYAAYGGAGCPPTPKKGK